MGQRRRARELAFLALYQADLLGETPPARLNELIAEQERPEEVVEFARRVVESIDRHGAAIDRAIREASPRWELERMAATDRAVLRQAVAELLFMPGVPEVVTINEAIEVAKRYGGDESGKFVNGVLDQVRRQIAEEAAEAPAEDAETHDVDETVGVKEEGGGEQPGSA